MDLKPRDSRKQSLRGQQLFVFVILPSCTIGLERVRRMRRHPTRSRRQSWRRVAAVCSSFIGRVYGSACKLIGESLCFSLLFAAMHTQHDKQDIACVSTATINRNFMLLPESGKPHTSSHNSFLIRLAIRVRVKLTCTLFKASPGRSAHMQKNIVKPCMYGPGSARNMLTETSESCPVCATCFGFSEPHAL